MTRLAALAAAAFLLGGAPTHAASRWQDWPMFGYTPSRQNVGPASTGITASNVAHLRRRQIRIDGIVDSSPVYLSAASVAGGTHDTIFFTTTYGKTEALDASSGRFLWRHTPSTYASYVGSAQVMTMTPLADRAGGAVYAGQPDGRIVKLALATGKVLWSTSITRDPRHEKMAGSLNLAHGLVLAATDGYIGDAPPYQGHVVSLSPANGRIVGVFNSLCSDRHTVIQPSTCSASDSAIWGRAAPVVDPTTGNLLVATGNAPWDGKTNWGDSVLVLSYDAKRLLTHWTPTDQATLNTNDLDLGSTAPAVLDGGYVVQAGKDGKLRLLRLTSLSGPNRRLGGEVQTVATPGGSDLFSAPAVWQGKWVYVADNDGTEAWRLRGGRLHSAWTHASGGTSPVVAGGLVFVQVTGAIEVYAPTTGRELAVLSIGETHWQSPIVMDGRVVAVEGNSNEHAATGVLDIYRR